MARKRRRKFRMRGLFFGRRGLGLWPVFFIVVVFASLGGIAGIEEFANVTLPAAILAMGFTIRWWAKKSALRRIPIPYLNYADQFEDSRRVLNALRRMRDLY